MKKKNYFWTFFPDSLVGNKIVYKIAKWYDEHFA